MQKSQFTKSDIRIEFLNQEHWLRGEVDGDYDFIAKVLPEPSEDGIGGGRIAALLVWNSRDKQSGAEPIIEYAHGWQIRPEDEETVRLLELLVSRLEEENP